MDFIDLLPTTLISVSLAMIVFGLFLYVKVEYLHRQAILLIDIIADYRVYCFVNDVKPQVDYTDIKGFEDMLWGFSGFDKYNWIEGSCHQDILRQYEENREC